MIAKLWRKLFPVRVQPEILGREFAAAVFDEWPLELKKITELIAPLKPKAPNVFEVELVTLRNFVFSYGIQAKEGFVKTERQSKNIKDAYFQTAANVLMRFGWDKDQFVYWNKIRNQRYDEYSKIIEKTSSFSDPEIGFAFLRYSLGEEIPNADQTRIGFKVSIAFGYWIAGLGKALDGIALID